MIEDWCKVGNFLRAPSYLKSNPRQHFARSVFRPVRVDFSYCEGCNSDPFVSFSLSLSLSLSLIVLGPPNTTQGVWTRHRLGTDMSKETQSTAMLSYACRFHKRVFLGALSCNINILNWNHNKVWWFLNCDFYYVIFWICKHHKCSLLFLFWRISLLNLTRAQALRDRCVWPRYRKERVQLCSGGPIVWREFLLLLNAGEFRDGNYWLWSHNQNRFGKKRKEANGHPVKRSQIYANYPYRTP